MKKLLLLSALILGTVTASQAGVRFSIGIPFPAPPAVVVAPPAPVYVQPAPIYVDPAPQVYAPAPPVVVAPPPVVVAPPVVRFGFGHPHYWHYGHDYHHDYYHRW